MPEMNAVPRGLLALVGLFVAALVTAQVLAVKVLGLALPITIPLAGGAIVVPAGVLAYALTFFASDCIAELYGKKTAQTAVNVGFGTVLVMLALVAVALPLPSARALGVQAGVPQPAFATVLGFTPNIVLGSLVAYVASQHWDVIAFHAIRERTGGERLWLRNVGSTATSQLLDTVVFILVAFLLAPLVLGIGRASPPAVIVSLIVGQYLLKLLIAVVDTPLVYAAVALARRRTDGTPRPDPTRP